MKKNNPTANPVFDEKNFIAGCNNLAKLFRAINSKQRIEILKILNDKGVMLCVNDIVSTSKIDQPNVSRHLSHLKGADLVISERLRKMTLYSLNEKTINRYQEIFNQFLKP